jgi:acyl carrier protein
MGMSRSQIEKELKSILLKIIDVEPEELTSNANIFKDLGVDSIKAIEITVAIEKYFKISIGEEDIANITTLSKAAEVIYKVLEKKT